MKPIFYFDYLGEGGLNAKTPMDPGVKYIHAIESNDSLASRPF